ncbi:hypothetical protein CPB86DRAFT_280882 [Serendipita vermifera]|nr:hypothetical protein CPB86DRAFT_280882 [Serendipita vermifera]
MVMIKDANELVMDTTPKARYAFLCRPSAIDSRYAQGASVEWEILKLQDAKMLPQVASTLSCPRIRRLDLPFLDEVPNGVPQFSDILSIFSEITWLDCTIKSWRMSSITATNRPPAILPKLEAFRCECQYSDAPTLSKFVLPSLRYLYIHFYASLREIPLFDILLSFRHSIQSVVVMIDKDKSSKQGIPFPQWSNFPELKELKLSQRWSLDFPPLPFDHPLQKLDALHKRHLIPSHHYWKVPTCDTSPYERLVGEHPAS